jgi:AP-4 complex subunit epsilon-1
MRCCCCCCCHPQAAYLTLTQLLDYKHELVLLLVNTLLSDLKSDNFVVVCAALVVTTKLIGGDLVNAGEGRLQQKEGGGGGGRPHLHPT